MIRDRAFWLFDKLRGGNVKSHFDDIQSILEKFDSEDSLARREQILKNILDHSTTNTIFYSDFSDHTSLNDFPIIDKIKLRKHFKNFQANAGFQEPTYQVQTSGSTGTPFQVVQDRKKKERNTADTLYFGKKGGYVLGQPLYYFRKWDKTNSKNPITKWIQNVIPIDVSKLTDGHLDSLTNKLSKSNAAISLIGYSSAYKDLCDYLTRKKDKLGTKVSSIIAIAEALSPKTKNDLESFFNTNVISRYSNAENGIIAQQLPGLGDNFYINWASYHVEILEIDSDKPVKNGQLGRIVITDLFNYCMPMIRYDTGDLGIMDICENRFSSAPVLTQIEGRKMDVLFDSSGNRISPYLAYEFEHFPQLKQFQVIQEGKKDYKVLLNIEGIFHKEEKAKTLLKKYLGDEANIYFEYVDEIPRLSSGKRKLTLNKYYQEPNL
ncbi:CoF synthetase [Flagellimonas sp.]|uniref:CoF synthetase n=1 Tax=Flagellimonas sp. TaxID=2058762 RepID=UPI003B512BAB